MGYLSCGPKGWVVDRGPIYTERLFGAAMKNTDKKMVSRTATFKNGSVVFIFLFLWSGLFCCVLVPCTPALRLFFLD